MAGSFNTKIGFSLYESGELKSAEPDQAILIDTPIGRFSAFDPNANGINADSNSLEFDESGRIISFASISNKVSVQTDKSEFFMLAPEQRQHPLYDDIKITMAMKVSFDFENDTVTITNDEVHTFSMAACGFTVQSIKEDIMGCTPEDCASCSLCQTKNNSMQ
jgi:hypothetical protein